MFKIEYKMVDLFQKNFFSLDKPSFEIIENTLDNRLCFEIT